MGVLWAATDPESGRYSATERGPDVEELVDHFTALRSRGCGYLEVRRSESEFPLLTLGFRDDRAVIHSFTDANTVSLLVGDSIAEADTSVHVPIMDELAVFSGDLAMAVDRAWTMVRRFVQTGQPAELGEWREL